MKRQPIKGEKITANDMTDKESADKIYIHYSISKNQKAQLKMGRHQDRYFSKEDTDGQQAREKNAQHH